MRIIRLSILLLLLFFSLAVAASRPALRFNHLTVEDGLPQSSANTVIKDSQGFLWIGTQDGLARFDGYSFKVFKHDVDNPFSISENDIRVLTESSDGYIWVGTFSRGLNRFDPETEQFKHYRHNPENPDSLSNDSVLALAEDSRGILWIGTRGGGLNRFDSKTERFSHYRHDAGNLSSLSHDIVRAIFEDKSGKLWIGTYAGGLNRFDQKTQKFAHYRFEANNPDSLSGDSILAIAEDQQGSLWVGTRTRGLNRFDVPSGKFTRYQFDPDNPGSLSHDVIRTIAVDQQGTLWVGTNNGGLNRFEPATQSFTRYRFDASASHSLSSDSVLAILDDRQGTLWIGTNAGGLNYFNFRTESFGHYRSEANNPESLSQNIVRAFEEDKFGNLWVGTHGGGLNRLDPNTGAFTHFRFEPDNPDGLSNDRVRAITEDGNGTLWVGTHGGGLSKFNPETNTFTHFRASANPSGSGPGNRSSGHFDSGSNNRSNGASGSLGDDFVLVIKEDHQGFLWLGTYGGGGLNRFDPRTQSFKQYRFDPAEENSLSHNRVLSIAEDHEHILWVGTAGGGLNRFDPETEKFTRYHSDSANPLSLSNDTVYSVIEDSRQRLWVGTANGLNRFDPTSDSFKHYTDKQGLPNNVIYRIEEDNLGYLWFSTNQGLARFNPQTETFTNYDEGDGLQNNEFNAGASFKNKKGELFFGGINGFNRFQPEQITRDTLKPTVVITDMLLLNESVPIRTYQDSHENQGSKDRFTLDKAIHLLSELTLSYDQNLVSFEFSALHFSNPKKNQYAYKLEGFDADWIRTSSSKRFATYTDLPGGDYVFRVKASNSDGVWNEEGASINIRVLPPPWKTWWAYSIYTLILLSLVFSFVYTQRKKLERERSINKKLQQVDKLKNEFLANTSHELRTPLNGIIGISDALVTGYSDSLPEEVAEMHMIIADSGNRLARLVDNILEITVLRGDQANLVVQSVNIVDVIEQAIEFNRIFADSKNLEIKTQIPEDLPLINVDSEKIKKVFINILENAIKFTQSGYVMISVTVNEKMLDIAFRDTGIGIDQAHREKIFEFFHQVDGSNTRVVEGSGLGLSIAYHLVQLHNGKIVIDSEVGEGALVSVKLPLS
ncbi:two-component regulator propeller domain-containing protein [Aliikangiella sp. G2MR2-5]|uniref:ligand-binding sensor domain-containing protein n=1 Tax=Aliikangiella sp. G2MR2-5 TaxID=2788943 RepID=UPI0018AB59E7|nr:sensor histidine kinase [Aliikangiella sp. G2MR2-5]